jgi:hypothetical protein
MTSTRARARLGCQRSAASVELTRALRVACHTQVVARPMALSERMVALACALTVDYDFFSQHSSSGGGMIPLMYPMPYPGGGGAEGAGGAAPGGAEGAGGVPGAGAAGTAAGAADEGFARGGDAGAGVGGGQDAGFGSAPGDGGEGFDGGRAWGEGGGEGEMKWDLPDSGGGSAGGEEAGGGIAGVLGTLWGLFGGGDE